MVLINNVLNLRTRMHGRRNRYFMFRNTDRLRKLKRFNILFGFLSFLSIIALSFAIGGLCVWFLVTVFTLGSITEETSNFLFLCGIAAAVAIGVLVLSFLIRFFIEKIYTRSEKKELTDDPEGAEKYLKVMKANSKVMIIDLVCSITILAIAIIILLVGFNEDAGIVLAVTATAVIIIGGIKKGKEYSKIAPDIAEIKKERKENKKLMIE